MKRSILYLEQQSWKGGAQQVLLNVLNALGENFRPIVAFPDDGPFRAHLEKCGIETLTYPLGTYRPGRKSLGEMLAFAWRSLLCAVKLTYFILSRNVCMVYINGPRCLPSGVLAARLARRPAIFHLHIIFSRRADVFLASWFARLASKVVACSNAAADSLLKVRPSLQSKTEVLYNPVPKLAAGVSPLPNRPHKPMTIGMVGRVTEDKGHHILIDAISKLEPRIRESLRLTIIGAPAPRSPEDDSYLARLKAHTNSLGIDEQVVWAGSQADMEPFYQPMDVLVVPSVGTEGLPLVLLEAMPRGIPVIATNTGGTSEIVLHEVNGLVVSPGNEGELAGALSRMLSSPLLYQQLSSGARATVDARFAPELFSMAIRSFALELCPPARTTQILPRGAEVCKWE
ncbi:MAG: glycosyltransferase family 4 protein [Acidobacteriia bacterium]|nr:glycosyltransferase family 4 protein [Terriglobia bacterium]